MTGEETCLAFRERGHDAPLCSAKARRSGPTVRVRELDHRVEQVAHEILSDVMASRAAGEVDTIARYKGKHALRWMAMTYPDAANPHFLGLLDEAGTLLGWALLTTTPSYPGSAMIGAMIRLPYRDHGLGTALVDHCRRHARAVLDDQALDNLFFDTRETNTRVLRIVEKTGMKPAGDRTDVSGNHMIGFKLPLLE